MTYQLEYRGMVNYYQLAYNLSQLNKLKWIMGTSLLKTLANKHKTSVAKLVEKYAEIGALAWVKAQVKRRSLKQEPNTRCSLSTFGEVSDNQPIMVILVVRVTRNGSSMVEFAIMERAGLPRRVNKFVGICVSKGEASPTYGFSLLRGGDMGYIEEDVAALKRRIQVARGEIPADLVLRNANLVNVCSGEIYQADIAIADGLIIGVDEAQGHAANIDNSRRYRGKEERDLQGRWVAPGLIDGHMHIESTMLILSEFARIVVPRGVTAVMLDPHEFANVMGVEGIRYVLESGKHLPLSAYVMLSSCVPASAFESPYQILKAEDLLPLLDDERVLGLAEMMNVPGVLQGDEQVLAKIAATLRHGRVVDGHAPGVHAFDLNAYAAAGIQSDHECVTIDEARQRIRLGMWLMIREGSAAQNLDALLPLIQELHPPRAFFVTDDRDPLDLTTRGHIDSMVRQAITRGLDPVEAIRFASYNTAQYFRLYNRGAITPGCVADLVVLDDLRTFEVESVYKDGLLVARQGKLQDDALPVGAGSAQSTIPTVPTNTIHMGTITEQDLRIAGRPGLVEVIGIEPGQIITRHLREEAPLHEGEIVADPTRDLLKLVVIERHSASGRVGLGLVKGFGLRSGAIASSVAHDAHNIVIAGVSDRDILRAAQVLAEIGGGFTCVVDGQVRATVPLPIGGLVSPLPATELVGLLRTLDAAATELGCTLEHPCMTLSFLSLSVIPSLKLTDQGLIDVDTFTLCPLQR